jgi:hypothetical protein
MAPSSIPNRALFDMVTTVGGKEKEEFFALLAQELLDDPGMRSSLED